MLKLKSRKKLTADMKEINSGLRPSSPITSHKPGRVYVKQDKKEIKLWKKTNRPKIKRAWEDPNTVILCEDESIISTQVTT